MTVVLKIIKLLVGLLPDFSLDIPSLEPLNDVVNIFAWGGVFLPIKLIMVLLGLTAAYYTFKYSFRVIKFIIDSL